MKKKLKTLSSSSEKSRAKLSCLSDRSGSSYILDCFSTVISGLAPSTLLPPYHAYTPHTPTPFHSHTLSHSSSSPLEVDENGPQLLLESEPCLKSAAEEGRGGGGGGGNEVDRCNEQKREENVGQNISLLS